MAWILPADVIRYSESGSVRERSFDALEVDIRRAQMSISRYCGKDFDDTEVFAALPESVKLACVILAEAYARSASRSARGFKRETFDEYSYEAENTLVDFEELGLRSLLSEFVDGSGAEVRIRKL